MELENQQKPSPSDISANALPKAYDPSAIEQRWADFWVKERLFDVPAPPADTAAQTRAFTILLPPPNVTGRLHMGHMLNQTEMDILTRWHRMRGETALWVPGTDHAGIATQMMVERQLASEGTNRKALGREAFTERVWQWKQQYGSAITDQMRRLGASVDWSREYFTMDERLSVAVKEAFVRLWEQGLIYRGSYIVNWDPVQQTAVSDLEVESEERIGKLYSIRYPFAGASAPYDETNSIVIATTRPETMLGDVAVAVNPEDPRYKHLVGTKLRLPLSAAGEKPDREIAILADDWAKPEFGTGAVKVTPAHDPNDFAIGQRHKLPSLTILDETAHVNLPGSPYHGLDRFAARERIVADLEAAGLLVGIKEHPMTVPVSQRSGAVIEPRLSLQWFLAVNKAVPNATTGGTRPSIAQTAIDAVKDGHIRFTPEMYGKTYFEWMGNIHDWCISRQLWWGHRIPAWHCHACGKVTVARDTPGACSGCGITDIHQETDVLDTWFSSGLLPFTVFGWPGEDAGDGAVRPTTDLAAFYPTALLVTGFDILFFWVARMIMLGCHFMLDMPMPDGSPRTLKEAVPFREVYIHALVRDANREKMSKTKGNVIDPIEIVTKYGTDAVRFTLASQASPGTDIAFSEARTEGYRAFANKIWNAARFLFMNMDRAREAGIDVTLPRGEAVGAPLRHTEANPGSSEEPLDSTLEPIAADHSILGKLANLIAASTPHGEAVLQTGNIDLSNQAIGVSSNAVADQSSVSVTDSRPLEAQWILTRLSQTAGAVNASLAEYRFDEAASHVYQFFWGELCDWYLEIVKLRLLFEDSAQKASTAAALSTLVEVFESALRLLSPFMPFLTEEIWHPLYAGDAPAKSIALARYPQAQDYFADEASVEAMQTMQDLITTIRALRKELGVPEREAAPVRIHGNDRAMASIRSNGDMLVRLARVSEVQYTGDALGGAGSRSTATVDVQVVYERQIDVAAERERLSKEIARLDKILSGNEARLGDEKFLGKAPAHIVEGLRKQTDEMRTQRDKAGAALEALREA
jgi:valyl-tRNA synthetase